MIDQPQTPISGYITNHAGTSAIRLTRTSSNCSFQNTSGSPSMRKRGAADLPFLSPTLTNSSSLSCRHDNAGPKFGIQLFDPTRVRAVETLSSDGNVKPSLDLLHIPTPWHNAVVRLADSNLFMLTKAKAVRAALEQGVLSGGLVQSEDGGGSYFALRTGDSKQPAEVPVRGLRPEGASRGKHLGDAAVSLEKVDATAIAAACKDRTVADPKSLYPWFSTHNTWLGSLRWITSWFWAKTP